MFNYFDINGYVQNTVITAYDWLLRPETSRAHATLAIVNVNDHVTNDNDHLLHYQRLPTIMLKQKVF